MCLYIFFYSDSRNIYLYVVYICSTCSVELVPLSTMCVLSAIFGREFPIELNTGILLDIPKVSSVMTLWHCDTSVVVSWHYDTDTVTLRKKWNFSNTWISEGLVTWFFKFCHELMIFQISGKYWWFFEIFST